MNYYCADKHNDCTLYMVYKTQHILKPHSPPLTIRALHIALPEIQRCNLPFKDE